MPGTVSELFPQQHAASQGMIHNEYPPTNHHHYSSSSLFYQGASTHLPFSTPALSSSHPLLLSSGPLLLFLILSAFFWSYCAISLLLLLLHPVSSPSSSSLLFLSCCSLHHPLTPSRLACKLVFLFLSFCFFSFPLCHPLTPFPSSAVLSPAFRLWKTASTGLTPPTRTHTGTHTDTHMHTTNQTH